MDILSYQQEAIDKINQAFLINQLSHAYIFESDKATTSSLIEIAYYFAKKILCKSDQSPCNICDNCVKIEKRVHPNIFLIEPTNDTIKKDQINSLIHEGQMTSVTDKERIYIINNADAMNRSSSNTLLKFLEEPSPDNYIILITHNIHALLETIVSRCQIIRFKPINKRQIKDSLISEHLNNDTAFLLSELFGSFDTALSFYQNNQSLIEHIYKVFNKLSLSKDLYIEYYLNKNVFNDQDKIILMLNSLIILIKQEIKYKETDSNIYFIDYLNKIDKDELNIDTLIQQMEAINQAILEIKSKVNIDLVLIKLFQCF